MDFENTVCYTDPGKTVNPRLSIWAYEALKMEANKKNKKISIGMVLTDALLLDGYTVEYNDEEEVPVESKQNELLENITYDGFVDDLRNIELSTFNFELVLKKIINNAKKSTDGNNLRMEIMEDLTDNQIKLWIPSEIKNQLPGRNMDDKITSALKHAYASPFDGFMDFERCKTDIVNYIIVKDEPTHPVARNVCGFKNYDSLIGVPSIDAIDLPAPSDGAEQDWWNDDSLTFDDLQKKEHTANGDGFATTEFNKRITAFENCIQNYMYGRMLPKKVMKMLAEVYNISSEQTLDKYYKAISDNYIELARNSSFKEIIENAWGFRESKVEIIEAYLDSLPDNIKTVPVSKDSGNLEGYTIYDLFASANWHSEAHMPLDSVKFYKKYLGNILSKIDSYAEQEVDRVNNVVYIRIKPKQKSFLN